MYCRYFSVVVLALCLIRNAAAEPQQAPPPEAGQKPNVIVFLADALRADHLGCYGYSRPVSPNIDAFSRDSYQFLNCYSQANWTKPSVGSLFTGVLPCVHGATTGNEILRAKFQTLAEIFKAAGYQTAFFNTNPQLLDQLGYGRGFDHYQYSFDERPEALVTDVLDWLRQKAKEPFFVYIHELNPHAPYTPPPETFQQLYGETMEADMRNIFFWDRWIINHSKGVYPKFLAGKFTLPHWYEFLSRPGQKMLMKLYDGEIAEMDLQFGRLMNEIKARGLEARTIEAFIADHGEAFKEHGCFTHNNYLFDEEIHVPLILRLPKENRPAKVPFSVGMYDLNPTLLSLCGCQIPSYCQAISLLGPTGDLNLSADRRVFSEKGAGSPDADLAWDYGMAFGQYEIIHGAETKSRWPTAHQRFSLYNRDTDPAEKSDLLANGSSPLKDVAEMIAQMKGEREKHLALARSFGAREVLQEGPDRLATKQREEQLAALGYLGGAKKPLERVPLEMLSPELLFLTDLAREHINAGELKEAANVLGRIRGLSAMQQEGASGPLASVVTDVLGAKKTDPELLQVCQTLLALFPQDTDLAFSSGQVSEKQGDLEGALRTYQAIVQKKPAFSRAYQSLAAVEEKVGHSDEALATYRRLESLEPGQPDAFVSEGRLLGTQGDWQGAVEAYRKAVAAKPGDAAIYGALSGALGSLGDKEGQLAALQKAEAIRPHDPLILSQEAELLATKGGVDNAVAKYRQLIELRPDDARALFSLGSLYAEKKAWEPALEALRKSYALEPANIAALVNQGPILESKGDMEGALAVFEKALETEHDDMSLLDKVSALLEEQGGAEIELRLVRTMVERHPKDATLRLRLAKLLDQQGDASGTLEAYRAAIALDPESAPSIIAYGDLLTQREDLKAAEAAYRTVIDAQPDNTDACQHLVSILEKHREFDAAIAVMCEMVERDPENTTYLIQQAGLLISMGASSPAATVYQTLLEQTPDDVPTWLLLGAVLEKNEDWAGALNAYRTAEKLDAQNIEAYLGEAQVLEEQKDDAAAVTAYHAAIALKPDDAALLDQVAFRLEQHKDLDGALAAFKQVQALDPARIDALAGEARILSAKRDWKEAEAAYRKAISLQPSDPSLWADLGHALQQLRNLPGALEAFQHARTLNASDSASWMSEGTILFDRGNFPDAIAAFKKVTELQPQNLPAWLCLGEVSNRAGQREEALKIFRHAIEIDRNSVLGLHAAARLAANLGHADEAAADCEQALGIDAQDQDARLLLGELAVQRHDFAAAFRQYAALLETNPGNDLALDMAVKTLEQHPEAAGAARALSDHMLEARSEDPQVHYLAGLVREAQQDLPEALAHFQKCAEANMPKPELYIHMGQIQEAQHNPTAALESYQKALKTDPQNQDAHKHISLLSNQ